MLVGITGGTGFIGSAVVQRHLLRGDAVREVFEIAAGGMRFEGRVADVKIAAGQISFDIYRGSQFDTGDRQPLITGVATRCDACRGVVRQSATDGWSSFAAI